MAPAAAPGGGGGGGGGNIKVVVRVRPFNGRGEFSSGARSCVYGAVR